jgi:hypothetical protein
MAISKTVLKDILKENEEFIRGISPLIHRPFDLPPSLKKVVTIYGVRRSGKSYFLYQLFREAPDSALYIDFEDERLADFSAQDFGRLKEVFLELKPHLATRPILFLLDEIQNVPGWEKFCRRLIEKSPDRVCVTGSSSKIMPEEIHTALRGRSWGIEILPFSFKEYLEAKSYDLRDLESLLHGSLKHRIKQEFADYLTWGGFPELVFLPSDQAKKKVIHDYLNAMFFKDLVQRYEITNIPLLNHLMDLLLSSSALTVSLSSFYRKNQGLFPFSKDSLYDYYNYFLRSLLVYETRVFSPSSYKRSRNPPKCYLADTGIARRVTSPDRGRLLENAVYLHYRRQGKDLHYYSGESECDLIAKEEERLSCLQVSYELTGENREREIKGLVEACKTFRQSMGLLLTFDDEEELTVEKISVRVLPFWKFTLAA